MELIRGLHNLREKHRGCVATIGNFDGVHLGHIRVLEQVKAKAIELGLPTTVVIFEPQPREFFDGENVPSRLTRFGEKVRLLEAQGVDRVLCLTFNAQLQKMTASGFIENLLLEGLDVKHFVVGDDFRFGCDRLGDYQMLKSAGQQYGFKVVNTQTFVVDAERVSSTRVRRVLEENDFELAERLLGRRYRIAGRVMHGQQLARQLGAPTANIRMHRFAAPLRGVYAVTVYRDQKLLGQGVCNIGMRPTVNGTQPVLEVHLFEYQGDLYGQLLSVEFESFLRKEQKFDGLEQLRKQIFNDIEAAQTYFAQLK
ncbi:bifunctional riboflavin kinase/FAD synthetase [Neptunomonas antarctica]|uniref:Riboflavin biosynthesis protein n=1 Tax=Neptunomonas antarctica TaxID=619304 RepID=A0A1N7MGK2_9GAMM|nr:bifunctional riboflavin kinase/FAD synthetase [Neptunomonas antarctica]SIS85284.1 FMN adenylyltransferase /riboflavin kinase [Neptunomonas antarctica]